MISRNGSCMLIISIHMSTETPRRKRISHRPHEICDWVGCHAIQGYLICFSCNSMKHVSAYVLQSETRTQQPRVHHEQNAHSNDQPDIIANIPSKKLPTQADIYISKVDKINQISQSPRLRAVLEEQLHSIQSEPLSISKLNECEAWAHTYVPVC